MAAPSFPKIDLRPTVGCVFAGLITASVFYGVTLLQTIFYLQTYPDDVWTTRALVVVVWGLDTLSLVFITNAVWEWLVVGFMNPLGLLRPAWTLYAEIAVQGCISLVVHLFMAYRIRQLNKKMTWAAVLLALLSFAPSSLAFYSAHINLNSTITLSTSGQSQSPVVIAAVVLDNILNLAFTAILCFQIRWGTDGQATFAKTTRIIDMLTAYLIGNNLLTSIITLSILVTFLASPKTLLHLAFNQLVTKAYANTFMAQLNARASIRNGGENPTYKLSTLQARGGYASDKHSMGDVIPISHTSGSTFAGSTYTGATYTGPSTGSTTMHPSRRNDDFIPHHKV